MSYVIGNVTNIMTKYLSIDILDKQSWNSAICLSKESLDQIARMIKLIFLVALLTMMTGVCQMKFSYIWIPCGDATKLIGSPMITITSYRCFIPVNEQSLLLVSMRLQLNGMELTNGLYHQFVLYQEFVDT